MYIPGYTILAFVYLDFDIEEGAGDRVVAGPNFVHFVNKIRTIKPEMIIGQPTYGYPAIKAEIDVINASWDKRGNLKNVADGVGIMVYEGTESLKYVQNYVEGADQWEGITVKISKNDASALCMNIFKFLIITIIGECKF